MHTSNSPTGPSTPERTYFGDAQKRILIMSAPRTGSTLLTDLLNQAQVGFDTQEFLHHELSQKYSLTSGSALSYIRKMALRHTHANGTFLCKTHYSSFVQVFENAGPQAETWLRYFTHFILLKRRDHLAQAISEYFAIKSGLWNIRKDLPDTSLNHISYSRADLEPFTRILSRQISEEDSWIETINVMKLPTTELDYEGLVADPKHVIIRLLQFLDMPVPDKFEPEIQYRPITDKAAVETFKSAYLEHLQGR